MNWNVFRLRNAYRKNLLSAANGKTYLLSVSASNTQRTIEDIEVEHSAVDGNSSSDDPLNTSAKRWLESFVTFPLSILDSFLSLPTESYPHAPVDPIVQFMCLALSAVKPLRRPHPQSHRNLILTKSLTNPNRSQSTRITRHLTRRTPVILRKNLLFHAWTVLWHANDLTALKRHLSVISLTRTNASCSRAKYQQTRKTRRI